MRTALMGLIIVLLSFTTWGQQPGQLEALPEPYSLKFPEIEWTGFLPKQKAEGNAAALYIQALDLIENYPNQRELLRDSKNNPLGLSQKPQIKKALAKVFDGARIKNCDFTIRYPLTGDVTQKVPNFLAVEIISKLLQANVDYYLSRQQIATAIALAKTIVALGHHLRQSGFTLIQELIGQKIQLEGVKALITVYSHQNITVLVEQAGKVERQLEQTKQIIEKKHGTLASFYQLQLLLKDAEPIFRLEALITIGTHIKLPKNMPVDPSSRRFSQQIQSRKDELVKILNEMQSKDPDPRVRKLIPLVLRKM